MIPYEYRPAPASLDWRAVAKDMLAGLAVTAFLAVFGGAALLLADRAVIGRAVHVAEGGR